jgi:hypothetical protein
MDMQTTTPAGGTNKVAVVIAIIAIIALALWFFTKPKTSTEAPQTTGTDETAVVQGEATQNFSSSDDTSALEADLNTSIQDLK